MATEVPDTLIGRRIYYERARCLLGLVTVRDIDPAAFRLTEPPTDAERHLGTVLGQAFHQGCSLADVAFATGLPADRVVEIGKRTIRRTGWLSPDSSRSGLASRATDPLTVGGESYKGSHRPSCADAPTLQHLPLIGLSAPADQASGSAIPAGWRLTGSL
jgi:hypothetical protein